MDIEPIKTQRDYRHALNENRGPDDGKSATPPKAIGLTFWLRWSRPGSGNIIRSIFQTR
jgi:hypothetical protein